MKRYGASSLLLIVLGTCSWAQSTEPEVPAPAPPLIEPTNLPWDASDRCLLLVFTSQAPFKAPRSTHTWAVIARTREGRIVDVQTISWMPADLKVKPLHLFVEPGRNLTLQDTVRWILNETSEHITLRGPFVAHPELYSRFVRQRAYLETGALGYQCLDFLGEAAASHNGVNCIHALTPVHGVALGDLIQLYGDASGIYIAETLQRRGLAVRATPEDEWLIPALGLADIPLRR